MEVRRAKHFCRTTIKKPALPCFGNRKTPRKRKETEPEENRDKKNKNKNNRAWHSCHGRLVHAADVVAGRLDYTHTPSTPMWYFGEDDAEDDDKSDGSTIVDDPCLQQQQPPSPSMAAKGGSCAVSPEQMQHDRDTISQFLLTHKNASIVALSTAPPQRDARINADASLCLCSMSLLAALPPPRGPLPVSGKIVVLDTALPVKAAFVALTDNGAFPQHARALALLLSFGRLPERGGGERADVKSAPLWDSEAGDYVGMITVSDFRNILRHFHAASPGADLAPLLEEHEIRTWRRTHAPSPHRPFMHSLSSSFSPTLPLFSLSLSHTHTHIHSMLACLLMSAGMPSLNGCVCVRVLLSCFRYMIQESWEAR